ncbi:hypothetical protein GCM10009117_08700 [Gangjinia marincola]|uniref:Spore coat protein CotH n=1 Tax=Gangjinia marincola TaxID=578463 RepID=A0ABP3XTQ2_9FLAO
MLLSQKIKALPGSYGVDRGNKVIIWHIPSEDSFSSLNTEIEFDYVYQFLKKNSALSYDQAFELTHEADKYTLYLTKLPVVKVAFDEVKLGTNKKIPGCLKYYEKETLVESIIGIRQRGNLSLGFPKKSYDIEVWKDSISKENKDIKVKGLRSDDDWILDGLYNEPLRLRSTVAIQLWTDIHKVYYHEEEPKAINGFKVEFVELFRNSEYIGLYSLSESVDRKQLQLKKPNGKEIYGELFKANSYEGGPSFKKAGEYNNIFPHYLGFKMEYPIIDYNSHWDGLSKLLDLVVNSSDATFKEKIAKEIHLPNAIDYFIYINLLRATDNFGKNYYLAKYDLDKPYFFVPWDVDGVFGIIQHGKRIRTTNDILSNHLFDRLLQLNPNHFNDNLKQRWKDLRENEFSKINILARFQKFHDHFTAEKIYEREYNLWKNEIIKEDDFDYLNEWIIDRLGFLDTYFKDL